MIKLGVDSGDTIRVPEAGNAGGRGRQHGNLFIKLKAWFTLFIPWLEWLYLSWDLSFTFVWKFDYQNILMQFKEGLCIQRLVIKEANVSCWNEEEPVFSSLERNWIFSFLKSNSLHWMESSVEMLIPFTSKDSFLLSM